MIDKQAGHTSKLATRYSTATLMDLAIQAHKQGQTTSFRVATSTYDVPRSTAKLRVKGIKPKSNSIAPNRRLAPAQEECPK
jgi:hypothetical protein